MTRPRSPTSPGHRNRKHTHPTADVQHRHAGLHIWAENLFGMMQPPPQPVVDKVPTPPGAYISGHSHTHACLFKSA